MICSDIERENFEEVEKALANVFTKPIRRKPSEWIEEHRRISPEANAKKAGRWRNLPFQVEPMDNAIDPRVQTTVLMWAAQTGGKTEVINGVVGYFCHQEPSPILVTQPDLNMAESWSKDRFMTMIRDTKPLAEIFSDRRQKRSGQKILHKTFPGGHVTIGGANSAASLAGRPVRVTIFDEVDRYPESAGREGDPVLLGEKRADSFPDAVSYKTSTPTIKRHSRIEAEFDLSDKNYWFVKCPHCDHEQKLKWSNVKWPDGPENAYYLCDDVKCGAKWTDDERVDAIWDGRWIATAPFKGVRGYHLNGIYCLFACKTSYVSRLHQMVEEFLKANRLGKEALKMWTNTFLAETWEDENDAKPEWRKLFDRRERYYPVAGCYVPRGVIRITAGIDIQADRIEMEFVGWGVGEESWGLGVHVLWGDTRRSQIYKDADALISGTIFTREDGAKLMCFASGWDTGYSQSQRQIYPFLRVRLGRRFYAFKGASEIDAEPISRAKKSKTDKVKLLMVGTNRIKGYIYNDATIEEPGPGFMHFPDTYDMEFFKQLLMEDSTSIIRSGHTIRIFTKPSATAEGATDRNEALDRRVYARGALYASGSVNWEAEDTRLKSLIPGGSRAPILPEEAPKPRPLVNIARIPTPAKIVGGTPRIRRARRTGLIASALG